MFLRLVALLALTGCFSSFAAATDVSFEGSAAYQHNGSTAIMTVDRIVNNASSGYSGTLRMELWAFATPFDGIVQSGYRLATYQLNPLDAGFGYTNVSSGTVAATRPGAGTWYLALLLSEYVDGRWLTRDHLLPAADPTMHCTADACGTALATTTTTATLSSNGLTFTLDNGEILALSGNIHAGASAGVMADIYIQVQINAGATFYLGASRTWSPGVQPMISNFPLRDVAAPLFYAAPLQNLPAGVYQFTLIVTRAGLLPSVAGNRLASGSVTVTLMPLPVPDPIDFAPPEELPGAPAEAPYVFDFYPFATGGNPPYHFQLDTMGGFPPIGLILAPDGILSGTPTIEGTTTFVVCAVDLSANQSCASVTITVEPEDTTPDPEPPVTGLSGTWRGSWTHPTSGLCDFETSELTWVLNQSGSDISGTQSRRITAVDPEGFCPYAVGEVLTDTLTGGVLTGSSLTIYTGGGTRFSGTLDASTLTGTGGSSTFATGPFSLNKQ